jgi:signal transduction histidine kinase
LLNLLGNAIKFTEKGEIRLTIKITPDLVITIEDTGIGIDKKYHKKIFEECFKVKPSYENNDYVGVGKGLYLVKQYVEELQGKITVQSAVNEGSTFRVEIPLQGTI